MAEVTLITGPPGSGKTEQALQRYQRALAAGGPGSALLLLPNAALVADARLRLARSVSTGLLNPLIVDFHGLVQQILEVHQVAGGEISGGVKQELLAQLAAEMNRQGKLKTFSRSAGQPGFCAALAQWITELKQGAILPETFAEAVGARGRPQKDRELAALYTAYQDRLKKANLYDAEGKLWRVRDLIRNQGIGRLDTVSTVVIDGFFDFDPSQFGIVESLAARVDRLVITLTLDGSDRRTDLFAPAAATCERVIASFGDRLKRETLPPRPIGVAALDWLGNELFTGHLATDFPADRTSTPAVTIAAGADREREIEQGVRRIKHRIVHDRIDPAQIALLSHSSALDARIEQACQRYGVPVRFSAAPPLSRFPIAWRLEAVLRFLEGEPTPDKVVALLRAGGPSEDEEAGLSIDRIDQLCREANLRAGRSEIVTGLLAQARRHRNRLERTDRQIGDESEAVARAAVRDLLLAVRRIEELFDRCDALPDRASFAQFAERFEALLEAIGFFRPAATGLEPIAPSMAIRRILSEAVLLDPLVSGGQATVSQQTFIDHLRRAIACTSVRPTARTGRAVSVLRSAEARGLFFDHLFIPSMLESELSAPPPHCPFYTDAERRALSRSGTVVLKERRLMRHDRRAAFYLAVTRARRSIRFSYPEADASGKPLARSHYLDELTRLLTGPDGTTGATLERETPTAIFPPFDEAAGAAELQGRLLGSLWRGDVAADSVALYNAGLPTAPPKQASLAARAEVCRQRDSSAPYGAWDGLLSDKAVRNRLTEQLLGGPISASRLDRFQSCPFAFFAEQLLHLTPLPEPEPELEPVARGRLVHDIAFEFFRRLREQIGATRFGPDQIDAIQSEASAASEKIFARKIAAGEIRDDLLWSVQRRLIVEMLRRFVRAQAANDGPEPYLFEVGFGFQAERDPSDPASVAEPLTIHLGDQSIALHGSIDRIDLTADGSRYRVLDYKTGQPPSGTQVQQGENLQLAIYLMAAEQLIFRDRPELQPDSADFIPLNAGVDRLHQKLQASGRSRPPINAASWPEVRERALDKIKTVVEQIRTGQFSVAPTGSGENNACRNCDYRPICLYAEGRHRRKSSPPPA